MDKDKAFFLSLSLSLSTTQHNTLGGNEKESDSIKTASSDKEKKNMEAGFQTTSALKESERERERMATHKRCQVVWTGDDCHFRRPYAAPVVATLGHRATY